MLYSWPDTKCLLLLFQLRQTLDTIASQSIAKQVVVCMAMEARDPKGQEVAQQVCAIHVCMSNLQLSGHGMMYQCFSHHDIQESSMFFRDTSLPTSFTRILRT